MNEPKTKAFNEFLKAVKADKKALIVIDGKDENIVRSARNIEGVHTSMAQNINVYDLLKYNSLVLSKDALNVVQEVFS